MISGRLEGALAIQILNAKGPRITQGLMQTLNIQTGITRAYIAGGTLPAVLTSRSGRLAGSLRAIPARVTNEGTLESAVVGAGGAAWYGRVHEYGLVVSYARKTLEHGSVNVVANYPQRSFMNAGLRARAGAIIGALRASIETTAAQDHV